MNTDPTADPMIPAAREFLDGARKRPVDSLPPSVLARECAELRRILGQVLGAGSHAGASEVLELHDVREPGLQHDETEQLWLKTRLLDVLPGAAAVPGDLYDAAASALAELPGDICSQVTSWLRQARAEAAERDLGPLRPVLRQALREAVVYQQRSEDPDSAEHITLYRQAASALGIVLGEGGSPD
jgi:hypothetical protein